MFFNNNKNLNGIILGKHRSNFIRANSNDNILIYGPRLSGKSRGFVVPNLLNWQHSTIIVSVGNKNFKATSGYRKEKGPVYCLNVNSSNIETHCYNPLNWISRKIHNQPSDVKNIVNSLITESGADEYIAKELVVGIALYLLSSPEQITSFGSINHFIRNEDFVLSLAKILDNSGSQIHPKAYTAIANFLMLQEYKRDEIKTYILSKLSEWNEPYMEAITDTSDFSPQRIKEENATIYINIQPDLISRAKPFIGLIINSLANQLHKSSQNPDLEQNTLLIFDDMGLFGYLENLNIKPDILSKKNVSLCCVFQNLEQVVKSYPRYYKEFQSGFDKELWFFSDDTKIKASSFMHSRNLKKINYKNDSFFKNKLKEPSLTPEQDIENFWMKYKSEENIKEGDAKESNIIDLSLFR